MDRIKQLQLFLEDTPNDPFLHYALAQEWYKCGDLYAAKKKYEYLIESFPDYVATYYHLGKLLQEQGEKENALEIYSKGILVAQRVGEQHSLSELQSAKLELEFDDD